MTGGSAAQAGIAFQNKVAAFLSVHLLADVPIGFLGLPASVRPTRIALETTAPVDDILLSTSDAGFCFINVKRSVSASAEPNSPLGSVADQFVRLWVSCHSGRKGGSWQRPLDRGRDRIVLVTGGQRSASFVAAISAVLDRIAAHGSLTPEDAIAHTAAERRSCRSLLRLLRESSRRQTGDEFGNDVLAGLLGMTRVVLLDPDAASAATIDVLLKTVVADPTSTHNAWLGLVSECQRLAETRTGADRASLRNTLRSHSVRLLGAPEVANDARRLEEFTQQTLASLAHLARIDVPGETGRQKLEIARPVVDALAHQATLDSFLIIGEPGAGKSGAVYSAAKQLIAQGRPVVVIAVERHPVRDLDGLRHSMGLDRDLVEVLRNWSGDEKGVLFIDALDASRGGSSDGVFRELIRSVLDTAPHWNVVASIRVFDLKFGVHYRTIFSGRAAQEPYLTREFENVRHFLVPQLTDSELEQVWSASPSMEDAYRTGTVALRDLLRSPFNLFLLANVLSMGRQDLHRTTTQLQLLALYWSYRIAYDDEWPGREGLLKRALELMLAERSLQVSIHAFDTTNDLDHLLSAGVLTATSGFGDRINRVSFAHHVLFDYAVARLILQSGSAPDLAARLTGTEDRALLMAPSAMMAFEILWEDDRPQLRHFWKQALVLAASQGNGGFCRMLPARTAAGLAQDVHELDPLLDCLRRSDCDDRPAALFLVRHCMGALAAGVTPRSSSDSVWGAWPRIARALADAAVSDVGWMLKPLISQWVEEPSRLTSGEMADVGAAARTLLTHGAALYDSNLVIIGIRGVARTFGAAPSESDQSLSALLSADHVAVHGHEELSWIAREVKYLVPHFPVSGELIRKTYRAGYCTPLPARDEPTNLGNSRILGLTSNRRQDFEHAQWELAEQFPRVFNAIPEAATELLIDVVACHTVREHPLDGNVHTISFGAVTAEYQADNSYDWSTRRDDYKAPPIAALEKGLVTLADSGRTSDVARTIDVAVSKNRLGSIWAAFLRAGAARPDVIGRHLVPLLFAVPVLTGRDTRKPAGDLIRSLHPLLSCEDRSRVERAIISTTEHTQAVLLGCLDERNIVLSEARERRRELAADKPLPANREPFEIKTRWVGQEEDWWLREGGVDLSTAANSALRNAIKSIEGLKRPERDTNRTVTLIADGWAAVDSLHEVLRSRKDIPERLLMSAWNDLAEVAGNAAACVTTPQDLARLSHIRDMVIGALDPAFWPQPTADPKAEASFAKAPSWSSPAPRVEAAGALMALARAFNRPDPELAHLIEHLARDPSPAVRHQILGRANMLCDADRNLMLRLCESAFAEETNAGVLSFFLPAISHVMGDRAAWFAARLLELDQRIGSEAPADDGREELISHVVQLLLRLWLVHDISEAGDRIRAWTDSPLLWPKRVQHAFSALRGAVIAGNPVQPEATDDRVRGRTVELFGRVVVPLSKQLAALAETAKTRSLTESEREAAENALRILDHASTETYFGSGAYAARQAQGQATAESPSLPGPEVRARFLREMNDTLRALAQVPYPSVTHHLLETLEVYVPDDPPGIFRLVTDALLSGGRSGGYQIESLGSDLFMKIVRRYLADYRTVLTSDEDLQRRLMRALDTFVEAGWPDARRLVYELPEMMR